MQSSIGDAIGSKESDFAVGYTVKGVHYPTLCALASAYHIKATTLSRRLRSQYWSLEQACGLQPAPKLTNAHHGKPLTIEGKSYASMAAACAANGIKVGIFHARRRNGWSIEEALGVSPRKKYVKRGGDAWVVAGTEYSSFREACKAFSLKPACVRSRLAMGWPVEEAFGIIPRTAPERLSRAECSAESGVLVICGKRFTWKHSCTQL